MFFKKRVAAVDYCDNKLNALFSDEQTRRWLKLKNETDDSFFLTASEKQLVDELLGANLQLLSLAINKKYHDINLAAEIYSNVEAFLEKADRTELSKTKDEYNRAFGASPSDGVLEMVRLFNIRLTKGKLSDETERVIYQLMYDTLSSYFSEFKGLKVVKS